MWAFTPDGKNLLLSSDRDGHYEIWMADEDFVPAQDTASSRRVLAVAEGTSSIESFGIAPDG